MSNNNQEYIDEFDHIHYATEELGRGGQGIVFKTSDSDYLLKLQKKKGKNDGVLEDISDLKEIQTRLSKLKKLKYLPLRDNINLAKPIALLKDQPGYIMKLLSSFKPIKEINYKDNSLLEEKYPQWIDQCDMEDTKKAYIKYCLTGSAKGKINLAFQVAKILSQVHENSVIYKDINDENIFYYCDENNNYMVWFIDCDNLELETNKPNRSVFTEIYKAPELSDVKIGSSTNSDCHSLAMLIYKILFMNSDPFPESEETDWGDSETNSDNINISSYEFDENWDCNSEYGDFLNENVEELLHIINHTFTIGAFNYQKRFSVYPWVKYLGKMADLMIECPECHMSYPKILMDSVDRNCKFCDESLNNELYLQSFICNGLEVQPEIITEYTTSIDGDILIPVRTLKTVGVLDGENIAMKIFTKDNIMTIEKKPIFEDKIYIASSENENFAEISSKTKIKLHNEENIFTLYISSKQPRVIKAFIKR